jgi:hypothetical protein
MGIKPNQLRYVDKLSDTGQKPERAAGSYSTEILLADNAACIELLCLPVHGWKFDNDNSFCRTTADRVMQLSHPMCRDFPKKKSGKPSQTISFAGEMHTLTDQRSQAKCHLGRTVFNIQTDLEPHRLCTILPIPRHRISANFASSCIPWAPLRNANRALFPTQQCRQFPLWETWFPGMHFSKPPPVTITK